MIAQNKLTICPTCGEKSLTFITEDLELPQIGIVPNVPHEKCSKCGEILFGPESEKIITPYENRVRQVA